MKDSSTAPPPPPPPDAIVEEEEEEGEVAGQEEEKGEEDMSAEVNLCGAVSMEEVRSLVVEWLDSSQGEFSHYLILSPHSTWARNTAIKLSLR